MFNLVVSRLNYSGVCQQLFKYEYFEFIPKFLMYTIYKFAFNEGQKFFEARMQRRSCVPGRWRKYGSLEREKAHNLFKRQQNSVLTQTFLSAFLLMYSWSYRFRSWPTNDRSLPLKDPTQNNSLLNENLLCLYRYEKYSLKISLVINIR